VEAQELQPDVEVHVVVEGDVLCSIAFFKAAGGDIAVTVGISDPALAENIRWALGAAAKAVSVSRFSPLPSEDAGEMPDRDANSDGIPPFPF